MTLDTRSSAMRTLPWPAFIPVGQLAGKPAIPLARPVTLVGSRHTANVRINSSTVSKANALVINSDGRLLIRDLASRMGTIVNGQPVREADLSEGDVVQIGRFSFKFASGPPSRSPRRKRRVAGARIEVDGAEDVPLNQRVVLVGHRGEADIPITDPEVSTAHCAIFDMNGKRYVRNLGSRTGTFINDQGAVQMEIRPGDTIRVGQTVLRYVPDASVEMPEDNAPPRPQPRKPIREEIAPLGAGDNGHDEAAAEAARPRDVDEDLDAPIPLELDEAPIAREPEAVQQEDQQEEQPEAGLPLIEPEPAASALVQEEETTTTWSTDAHGEAHVVNVEQPEPEAMDLVGGPAPEQSGETEGIPAAEAEAPAIEIPQAGIETPATAEAATETAAEEDAAFDFLMDNKPAAPAEPVREVAEDRVEEPKAETPAPEPVAEEDWTTITSGSEAATPDVVALDLPLDGGGRDEPVAEVPVETPAEVQGEATAALADLPFGDGEPVDAPPAAEAVEAPVEEESNEEALNVDEPIGLAPAVEEPMRRALRSRLRRWWRR